MKDLARPLLISLTLGLIALAGMLGWAQFAHRPPLPAAGHLAVILNSGVAYYGTAVGRRDGYLELSDVHYVRQVQNEQSGGPSNVLVRRGQEAHGPAVMLIPRESIAFIETVSPDSEIGRLIAGAR